MSASELAAPFSPSDGELIVRVGRGDRDAFGVLHARFARPIQRLAFMRLGDRGRAEDAVQETFAKVWRGAGTYRPERGAGGAWLYAVARNTITNQLRAPRELVGEVVDAATDEPGPAESAESEWTKARLQRALEALPGHEQELIRLAYWSGLSQAEIASRLGIPLGTVKTRNRRALMRLAEILDGEEIQ
jgi:RNA polymerase sigma-70 factor (ECF subfamily)